jgi:hypothetical protein
MSWAASSGSTWVTLGLVPLSGGVGRTLELVRRSTAAVYDFEGLRAFKTKLWPHHWTPIFIAYPRSQSAMTSLYDALVAFAGGSIPAFVARSIRRGPTLLVHALTVLLVGGIVLLLATSWAGTYAAGWWCASFVVIFALGLIWTIVSRRARARLA